MTGPPGETAWPRPQTRPRDSYIGARLTRPDGPPKVSGEARYAADLSLPGMLHVRLLLSPYAHARIVGSGAAGRAGRPGRRRRARRRGSGAVRQEPAVVAGALPAGRGRGSLLRPAGRGGAGRVRGGRRGRAGAGGGRVRGSPGHPGHRSRTGAGRATRLARGHPRRSGPRRPVTASKRLAITALAQDDLAAVAERRGGRAHGRAATSRRAWPRPTSSSGAPTARRSCTRATSSPTPRWPPPSPAAA